ncbi:aldehyde dehydrogenase family protein [Ectopseudomonas oleovorans]|uniref:Aldehyde dehydrogenase family protein n=1 Tax=Ectopseudomonas oleovorans TaxID=301 RepID=A0AA42Q8P1_ECTOL|nr:aldehyde dehydrogenase family protein [Pseudomonas oleovorans]MDH1339313.1 aldehyde dehydrogenase family protein [Pseudomonas oleovorans]MDH1492549.1 aldehyde dehydrogenase family protein [Pseudomonas oleovorans]WGG21202.1 aldehyde dehydrogenase family protein [Pseudomonas oleovorans]
MSDISLLPQVREFLQREHAHFIDGRYCTSASAQRIAIINPANGEAIAQVAAADTADVEAAVGAAHRAFTGSWAATSPYQRGVILNRFADLIEANGEELAQLETLCSGKSIHLSRMFEVGQSAVFLRYYAGWATKINGETMTPSLPSMAGEQYTAFTRREPVGVVAGIVPWNFSVMIGVWKIAAALVTGCTLVLKPSEFTPLTLLRLAELALEAGVPAGALNVLNGNGEVGAQLIAHPQVAKVSFTGSVPTGLKVGQAAMAANLTRVTLELGGKNAAALLPDFDLPGAVAGLIQTGYVHQGQVCAAPERIYVPRARLEEVAQAFSDALRGAPIGSPLDESVQFGPLANKPQLDKMLGFFATAHEQGRIVCGGNALACPGYFVEPTVVIANSAEDSLLHEETFGPILTLLGYDDISKLPGLINDSPFGLTASIWSNDLSSALRLIPQLEAGTVYVNMHTFLDPAVPFGGIKASGTGREFGSAFIDDYTELKSVMIRY